MPLHVHANYNREEILAAFGASTAARPMPLQTGVYWHEETQSDLLFITLQKSERDYSPTTRYLDYAISDELFHLESQANAAADSKRGLDYIPSPGAGPQRGAVHPPDQDGLAPISLAGEGWGSVGHAGWLEGVLDLLECSEDGSGPAPCVVEV